jgi:GNAT superfamily N-acetyltransferase
MNSSYVWQSFAIAGGFPAILAVRPDRQGQGTGTALLCAYHALLDVTRACLPTWRPPKGGAFRCISVTATPLCRPNHSACPMTARRCGPCGVNHTSPEQPPK